MQTVTLKRILSPFSAAVVCAALVAAGDAARADIYVATNSPSEAAPYDTWDKASHNLKTAVDFAGTNIAETVIWLTNGIYNITARMDIYRTNLTIRGVNGAAQTIIKGNGSVRIFYMRSSSRDITLEALTIRDGYNPNSDGTIGGAAVHNDGANLVIRKCMLLNNYAQAATYYGDGGAVQAWGSSSCLIENSVLAGNVAERRGGAVESHAGDGYITLVNCTLTENKAYQDGGAVGTYGAAVVLTNCIVYGNHAPSGPNYQSGSFAYCSADPKPAGTGNTNTAPVFAKAGYGSGFSHGIGDYRLGPASSNLFDLGTALLATDIEGTARPQGAGHDMGAYEALTNGTGPLRASFSVSTNMGFVGTPVTLTLAGVAGSNTTGLTYNWYFGDGNTVSGVGPAANTYLTAGIYLPWLVLGNGSETTTNYAPAAIKIINQNIYVSPLGNNTPPYTNWTQAATGLQPALDVADAVGPYGSVITVASGTYDVPAPSYCFTITNGNWLPFTSSNIVLRSVSGPTVTILKGNGAYGQDRHVVWIQQTAQGVVMDGFTLTNGWAYDGGGMQADALCTIQNCIFRRNKANEDGGAFSSHAWFSSYVHYLRNCLFVGNECERYGGAVHIDGVSYAVIYLDNCTLVGNACLRAGDGQGGGIGLWQGTCNARNSIVYGNSASNGAPTYDNWRNGSGTIAFNYTDTVPLPGSGTGNLSVDPLFINAGSGYGWAHVAGNYRLPVDSPCVNTGNNAYVTWSTDLDGIKRITGAKVDLGAYEYRPPLGTVFAVH